MYRFGGGRDALSWHDQRYAWVLGQQGHHHNGQVRLRDGRSSTLSPASDKTFIRSRLPCIAISGVR